MEKMQRAKKVLINLPIIILWGIILINIAWICTNYYKTYSSKYHLKSKEIIDANYLYTNYESEEEKQTTLFNIENVYLTKFTKGTTNDMVHDMLLMPELSTVTIQSTDDVNFNGMKKLNEVKKLENLVVYITTDSLDLSELKDVTWVKYLTIINEQENKAVVTNFDSLSQLENITLENVEVKDYGELASISTLNNIRLSNVSKISICNTKIDDISAIASCNEITLLGLYNTMVSNITDVIDCENLKEIYIDWENYELLDDIYSLSNFKLIYDYNNTDFLNIWESKKDFDLWYFNNYHIVQ